jgi:DNA-binding transcriptional ArsR family regulator
LRSLKDRITAAAHQQYVLNYDHQVRPLPVFIQRMEYDQRTLVRFLCKDHISLEEVHARLEAQFGDAIYGERSVRWWCQYVRQRREDLHDKVRSGKLPIDFLDIRILALLEEQTFHSAHSIAEALGVSHSTILNHLLELLGIKNSFTLDPARVHDQFVTDSDGNLPRVTAHSQGSRGK